MEKDLFQANEQCSFWKTMENVRKNRGIKLVTTEKRGNYLVSGSNYHATICFEKAIEMKKKKKKKNTIIYEYTSLLSPIDARNQ